MWKALSYRQRNRLLYLAAGVGALLVYQVSLRPTLTLWQANAQQAHALQQLAQAPARTRHLQQQAAELTGWMRSFRRDSTRQDSEALDQLTQACRRYGVTLASWSAGERTRTNGYVLETRLAKLRGDFRGLERVVYHLEYAQPVGRLSSVRFALEEDRRQRRTFLYAYLYLQTIALAPHAQP